MRYSFLFCLLFISQLLAGDPVWSPVFSNGSGGYQESMAVEDGGTTKGKLILFSGNMENWEGTGTLFSCGEEVSGTTVNITPQFRIYGGETAIGDTIWSQWSPMTAVSTTYLDESPGAATKAMTFFAEAVPTISGFSFAKGIQFRYVGGAGTYTVNVFGFFGNH